MSAERGDKIIPLDERLDGLESSSRAHDRKLNTVNVKLNAANVMVGALLAIHLPELSGRALLVIRHIVALAGWKL